MSIPYFAKYLQEDEKIKLVVYRSAWMYIPALLFETAVLWAALFSLFLLQKNLENLGLWIVVILILSSLFGMARTFMKLKYTAWVITNKRIIDFEQHNFWNIEISDTHLHDLERPVMGFASFWGSLAGCATIQIQIKSERALLEINGVRQPKKLIELLRRLTDPMYEHK